MKKSKKPAKKYHFGIQCAKCKQRIFSYYTHDFKYCRCKEVFVDGGLSYLRYGWNILRPKRIRFTERLDGPYPIIDHKEYGWPY